MKKGDKASTEATEDLTILDFLVGGWCFNVGATKLIQRAKLKSRLLACVCFFCDCFTFCHGIHHHWNYAIMWGIYVLDHVFEKHLLKFAIIVPCGKMATYHDHQQRTSRGCERGTSALRISLHYMRHALKQPIRIRCLWLHQVPALTIHSDPNEGLGGWLVRKTVATGSMLGRWMRCMTVCWTGPPNRSAT